MLDRPLTISCSLDEMNNCRGLAQFAQSYIARVWRFIRYLRRFFKVRRRDPQDDLTSALIKAEEAGEKLSEDELLAMVFLLLIAGHETTVNLIGNGTLALLQNPDQMEKLRGDGSLNQIRG